MKTFVQYLTESKLGNCFETAGRTILKNLTELEPKESDEYSLVHAFVRGKGPLEGRRFVHAWIEWRGMVVDKSNGNDVMMSDSKYYALGKVEPKEKGAYVKYDRRTAQRNMGKFGHYGPWSEIDESLNEGHAIPDKSQEIGKQKIRLNSQDKKLLKGG